MMPLSELKLGDELRGKVVELFPDGELLMSFEGSLLRVQNETRRPLDVGQFVMVVVKTVNPVRFQLLEDRRTQRRRGHIDFTA